MATRDTASRRYAEAAFQVAVRDDTVATWRAELDAAGEIAADEEVGRMLANPAAPLEIARGDGTVHLRQGRQPARSST